MSSDGGKSWGNRVDFPWPVRDLFFFPGTSKTSHGLAAGGNFMTNVGGLYHSIVRLPLRLRVLCWIFPFTACGIKGPCSAESAGAVKVVHTHGSLRPHLPCSGGSPLRPSDPRPFALIMPSMCHHPPCKDGGNSWASELLTKAEHHVVASVPGVPGTLFTASCGKPGLIHRGRAASGIIPDE